MPRVGFCLIFCFLLAWAQEAPATVDTSKTAVIEGIVVNELTKEPIRKAEISLYKQGKSGDVVGRGPNAAYSAVTDPSGKFRIENIDPGDYALNHRKAGFVTTRANYGLSTRILKLAAGQSLTGLRYSLQPQAILTGRVLDDEGDPVQGVPVALLRYRFFRGSYHLTSNMRPQQTNDRGEFRFIDLQPGRYYLQADAQRFTGMPGSAPPVPSAAPGELRTAFVATYYPNATEIAQATRIEVQAGQELAGRDIGLRKEKVVRVSGKVLDMNGAPAKQAFVSLVHQDASMGGFSGVVAPMDENGVFAANNVPPGQYTVRAMKGDGSTWQSGETSITIGDNGLKDVVVQIQPALEAKGQIVLEGSDRKDFDFSGIQLVVQPVNEASFNTGFGDSKSDGTITVSQLSPGRYTLDVFNLRSSGSYVKTILAGTEEVFGKEVDANALVAGGVKIVLRLDAASITGSVEVPEERKAFLRFPSVVLVPADAQLRKSDQRNIAQLDQDNGYSLKNIRPGDYIAFAFEEYDYASLQDPESFAILASKGTAVSLAAGESKSLALKILPWPEQFADRIQ